MKSLFETFFMLLVIMGYKIMVSGAWDILQFIEYLVCDAVGERGRRIRELTSVIQKRFKFPENGVELYAEKVNNRGLCAIAQAESLRYKLLGGLAVRRYFTSFVLLYIMVNPILVEMGIEDRAVNTVDACVDIL
jgi:hypothetical protein